MRKRKGRQSEITETLIHSNGEDDEHIDQRSQDSENDGKSGFFACYLLTSLCPRYKGQTYIGFTVNPRRRIRQHNGELCSGAWRTKKKRPWEMVLCIYGFPTNVVALQFEWAWQHPVESLAVRNAAVGFKSLGGLANKIKLAYTMLTLPAWNNLNLSVNFFSTKYTKHYAGCPKLPGHMRVHVRSMDELPCYTEAYKEDEEDMFRFADDVSDDDEELEKSLEDATIPVPCSTNHQNNQDEEEAICVSDTGNYEQPSQYEDVTIPNVYSANHHNSSENYEPPSCTSKDLWNDDKECETVPVPLSADHRNYEKQAICVSDDEKQPKRSFMNSDCFNVVSPTTGSENSGKIEVVDLFTPSPEYRISSGRKKIKASVVCPEIIDLTESPICV